MAGCCSEDDAHLKRIRENQKPVLWIVLALNAVMFVGEFAAGWIADSSARLANSLDMLGDTMVYGISLAVTPRAHAPRPFQPVSRALSCSTSRCS